MSASTILPTESTYKTAAARQTRPEFASSSIKDILVQVDASASTPARLDLAFALAARHEAHLTGLCVIDVGLISGAGYGGINVEDCLALMKWREQLREEARLVAAGLQEQFEDRLRRAPTSGEWRLVEGNAATIVPLHARYADLAILGQPEPDETRTIGWTGVLECALLASGRPVLVVPYAGRFQNVGRRVLIGWDARREASRAVHDALPLLQRAEKVVVLAVDPQFGSDAHGDLPPSVISRHLARHGVPVSAQAIASEGMDVADVLLNAASDLGCDLIVIGGYCHSRLRETIFGGVTRRLLHTATIPMLMSH